jgi:hypothetical protein
MNQENKTVYLSDESIGMIAKLVQIAILTGTDVTDNLRTLRLSLDEDKVYPDPEFLEDFDRNIENMLEVSTHGQFN